MDVKKIGRIPDGGCWRAHGRKMGSENHKATLFHVADLSYGRAPLGLMHV